MKSKTKFVHILISYPIILWILALDQNVKFLKIEGPKPFKFY